MKTWVALLRGINVGGKNKVPMKALASLVEGLGHSDVTTYIASGNVVFRSKQVVEKKVAAGLQEGILKTFKLTVPVLMRTHEEMVEAATRNPFLVPGEEPGRLYVMFLGDVPAKAALASLDPNRSAPDAFSVVGRDVYLRLPTGAAKTKLTVDYFESRLKTPASARNWNTVNKLVELSRPS